VNPLSKTSSSGRIENLHQSVKSLNQHMERAVEDMQTRSKFLPPAAPVPPPDGLPNVPGTSHFATVIRCYMLISLSLDFLACARCARVEERDSVDPENLPGLQITRDYPDWSYLAYYWLDFKTISL
jgi:hypothetical protein